MYKCHVREVAVLVAVAKARTIHQERLLLIVEWIKAGHASAAYGLRANLEYLSIVVDQLLLCAELVLFVNGETIWTVDHAVCDGALA